MASNPAPTTGDAPIPRHVAIIMDGNGRWAKARRLPRLAGHKQGVEAVRRVCAHILGEVDRQLRHPQDRVVDPQQALDDAAVGAHADPAGQAQVAVEPGVEQGAAVRLERDDLPAGARPVRMLLDAEVRAVGVTADQPERGGRAGRAGRRGSRRSPLSEAG